MEYELLFTSEKFRRLHIVAVLSGITVVIYCLVVWNRYYLLLFSQL